MLASIMLTTAIALSFFSICKLLYILTDERECGIDDIITIQGWIASIAWGIFYYLYQ